MEETWVFRRGVTKGKEVDSIEGEPNGVCHTDSNTKKKKGRKQGKSRKIRPHGTTNGRYKALLSLPKTIVDYAKKKRTAM